MNKFLLPLLFVGFISLSSSNASNVYVCANGSTSVYHASKSCSALKRCSHEVQTMTESAAKKKGLRLCKKG